MEDVDIETFGVIENSLSKDKRYVYYKGDKIKDLDIETLEILTPLFLKDKNDFYYEGKKLNMDMKTSHYTIGAWCLKVEDKNKKLEYNCKDGWSVE